jgi:hypothetical protein
MYNKYNSNHKILFLISRFRRDVDDICGLLGYYPRRRVVIVYRRHHIIRIATPPYFPESTL